MKKLPQDFPFSFHAFLHRAYEHGSVDTASFPSQQEALAYNRRWRRFLTSLPLTPRHKSSLMASEWGFRNHLSKLPDGVWLHTLLRGTRKVNLGIVDTSRVAG